MSKKIVWALIAIAVVALIALIVKQRSAEQGGAEPIKIGWIGPLSGDLANMGNDTLVSTQIAIDEVNAAGGIDGRPLQLIAEDGGCSTGGAVPAGNKLINIDKVTILMGMCSPEVVPNAQKANDTKTVLISSCASAPTVTDAGDYVFRTYPSDAFQGKVAAEYVYNDLNVRKVAILSIQNEWGLGLKNEFSKRFTELSGEVALIEEFTQGARDLRGQLTKIEEANVGAVYFPSFTESALAGLKQMQDLGMTMPVVGGDAWDDSQIHESGFAEGIFYLAPKAQYQIEWKEKMTARGADHTVCAPTAYDNVMILADIMKEVGTDGEQIKNALYGVKDYQGVNGVITFDKNGDITTAEYDIRKVINGKAETIK